MIKSCYVRALIFFDMNGLIQRLGSALYFDLYEIRINSLSNVRGFDGIRKTNKPTVA